MHSPILSAEAAAAEAADRNQAEHFIHALNESCVEIDRRIAKYQTAMADYEARRCTDDVRRCRR